MPVFYSGERGRDGGKQKDALSDFSDKVTWAEDLDGLPDIEGIFFSNELVDAFPFHRVKKGLDGLSEIYVCLQGGSSRQAGQAGQQTQWGQDGPDEKLAFVTGPLSTQELEKYFRRLMPRLPAGMVTEANLRVSQWMGKLGRQLKRGFVITVDYGYTAEQYYSPSKMNGTALCHYRHSTNEDFFERVGSRTLPRMLTLLPSASRGTTAASPRSFSVIRDSSLWKRCRGSRTP